jgi:Fic family protein
MLFQTPELNAKDLEVIARINEAKASASYAIRIPPRWTGLLKRSALGRAIRGSNSIEGYRIGREDVVAAAEGEALDATEETKAALEGYRRAMTLVLGAAKDPTFAYSSGVIKGLHFMMVEHTPEKHPGHWRSGAIYVVDDDKGEPVYEGPDAGLVDSLMGELVSAIANTDDGALPIVKAAMAHLNLVMIHPFADGNGRMARCLQTLVLGTSGTLEPEFSSIEEYLGEHHRAYYDILVDVGRGSWHPELSAYRWIRFILRAHYFQAQTLLRRLRESERLWAALEGETKKRGLPERMVFALWDAANGFKVRNGTYRSVADIAEHSASRDLKALVDVGLLDAQGEKRARFYNASAPILLIRKNLAESRPPIADPFEEAGAAIRVPPPLAGWSGLR